MGMTGVVQNPFGVSPEDRTDGQDIIIGRQKDVLVSNLMPDYYQMSYRSKLFAGNQLPAGAAPALWSATTQQCGLFNPLGSGVNLVLMELNAVYVSGTGVVDGIVLGYKTGCGAAIATGAAVITAATTIAGVALNLSGAVANGIFMSAAITTAAPVFLTRTSLGQQAVVATGTAFTKINHDFKGGVVVPPGGAIFVGADITGITAVYSFGLVWGEVKE